MTATEVIPLRGYGAVALDYHRAGWHPLPLPPGRKKYPPSGVTGYDGAYPSEGQIVEWTRTKPTGNLALRLPVDVVGVDVDVYHGGEEGLAELVAKFGPLPLTVMSTSRTDGSAIRLFRVPAMTCFATDPAQGVDMIQYGHRYVVAPPSLHPEGRRYRWIDEASGEVLDAIPDPAELPDLPWSWLEGLKVAPKSSGVDKPATPDELRAFIDAHTEANRPQALKGIRTHLADNARPGGRHDTLYRAACWALREAAAGYYTAADALEVLEQWWGEVIDDARRLDPNHRGDTEFGSAVAHALAVISTEPERIAELRAKTHDDDIPEIGGAADGEAPVGADAPEKARFVTGGSFLLDIPEGVPAVWGSGDEVLWAKGEPFLLCGPPGVGKTTVMGQVLLALLGVGAGEVLGWPVTPARRVLYLASDRPSQIARALARGVSEGDRQVLDERLVVWKGPPPADIAKHPELLVELCRQADADVVILDSVKDMAVGISEDEVGAGLNRAVQIVIADGRDVGALHHQRKGQGGVKPTTLEDVYGSTWITAGAGSVVLLWGQAGDIEVELHHLKQPAAPVGPLKIEHDHHAGTSTVVHGWDALRWLRLRPDGGTAPEAAQAMTGKAKPTSNETKKARRKLDHLVAKGLATRSDTVRRGDGGALAGRYFALDELGVDSVGAMGHAM